MQFNQLLPLLNLVAFNKLTLHVRLEVLKPCQTQTTEIITRYGSYPFCQDVGFFFPIHVSCLCYMSDLPPAIQSHLPCTAMGGWVGGLGNPGLPSAAEQLQEMFLAEIKPGVLVSPPPSDRVSHPL